MFETFDTNASEEAQWEAALDAWGVSDGLEEAVRATLGACQDADYIRQFGDLESWGFGWDDRLGATVELTGERQSCGRGCCGRETTSACFPRRWLLRSPDEIPRAIADLNQETRAREAARALARSLPTSPSPVLPRSRL